MSEEMRSSGPLRSPGVSGPLSICDGLDAALYREKDVQQIGVYQDGDCHNAISPRALHQIQLDQHPGESESDDPCVKAHAYAERYASGCPRDKRCPPAASA